MRILELFKTKEIPLIIAKIITKISATQFQVEDTKGRRYIAESDGAYIVGMTVIIKNGVIVSKTKSLSSFGSYVV